MSNQPSPVDSLKSVLSTLAEQAAKIAPSDGYKFTSHYDLILKVGVPYTPQPLPKWLHLGIPKHCYSNAYETRMRTAKQHKNLRYCEGYILSPSIWFPVAHAWVVDVRGRAYDATLAYDPDRAYIGVPLMTHFYGKRRAAQDNYHGILENDYMHKFDLLKSGFPDDAIATTHLPPELRALI